VLPTFEPAPFSARNALAIVFKSKRLQLGLIYVSTLITIKSKILKLNLVVTGDIKFSAFYNLHMYSICVRVKGRQFKDMPGSHTCGLTAHSPLSHDFGVVCCLIFGKVIHNLERTLLFIVQATFVHHRDDPLSMTLVAGNVIASGVVVLFEVRVSIPIILTQTAAVNAGAGVASLSVAETADFKSNRKSDRLYNLLIVIAPVSEFDRSSHAHLIE
jgi:hypothetical protein